MKSIPNLIVGTICLLISGGAVANAEMAPPPGKAHCLGRIVRLANGDYATFRGNAVMGFPLDQQTKLKERLGEFIDIEYLRLEDNLIGPILTITTLAKGPSDLPMAVTVVPSKNAYTMIEPIEVRVTITNRSGTPQPIHNLPSSRTVLCQDYSEKLQLEPSTHYAGPSLYQFVGPIPGTQLAPGATVEFQLTSTHMAEPGDYQMVYVLCNTPHDLHSQSEIVPITILPATPAERDEALHVWQQKASIDQKITIAEELCRKGDAKGIATFLSQMKAGEYTVRPGWCYDSAYTCAFQYGGEAGQAIMTDLLEAQIGQDRFMRMIPGIRFAPDRIALLRRLLENRRETMRDTSGWVDKPRICDLTAAWLADNSIQKMKFPSAATETERNSAVSEVVDTLNSNPKSFPILFKEG